MNPRLSHSDRLRAWERDVINRQRNIVFPDTVLNEGRFYRNIASGKAIFTRGQKISLLLILLWISIPVAICITSAVANVLAPEKPRRQGPWVLIYSLLWPVFLWTFLTVKGLFPAPQRKRRRRG